VGIIPFSVRLIAATWYSSDVISEKTRDELVRQFNDATDEQKRDRGVDRIVTFLPDEYKILNDDRVDFGDGNEATVPLVGMYILEKIKDMQTNIDKIAE
jgi:hypothetical protein